MKNDKQKKIFEIIRNEMSSEQRKQNYLFNLQHAPQSLKRANAVLRQNHIWNITTNLLTEVSEVVREESQLQPLRGDTFCEKMQINHIKLEFMSVCVVFG